MSLGALTTTFTPPADCLATDGLYWVNTQSTFYWLYGKPYQTSCFPDNYQPYQNDYYSPGICPSGYVERCQQISSSGTFTETTATCCPANGNFVCASTSSSYSYPWGATLGCMSVYMSDFETSFMTADATWDASDSAGKNTMVLAPGTIMAYGIPIRRQRSDVQPTTTKDGTSASTGSASSATGASSSSQMLTSVSETASSAASSSTSSSSTGGLSNGAAAGIGVGATVAVLLVLGAVAYMFWSRRRQRRQQDANDATEMLYQDHRHQYHPQTSNEYAAQAPMYEQQPSGGWGPPPVNGAQRSDWGPAELSPGHPQTYEMTGESHTAEKDGKPKWNH